MELEREGEIRAKAEALCKEALNLQLAGKIEGAMDLYKASIETFPTAEAFTFLGWTHSHRGELEVAISYCKKAIEVDPSLGNPYNDIGAYLVEMGQDWEAIPWFFKALASTRYDCPFYPHVNLARVYENHLLWHKAQTHYAEALRLKPDYMLAQVGMDRLRFKEN